MSNLIPFIKSHLADMKSKLFTQLPAVVTDVSLYESENIITVKPLIDMLHSDAQVSECPEVYNVPVINPSGGGGILSFPIKVGDTVLLEFSMRNIEAWLEGDGSSVTEDTMRSHTMTDGIAVIGLYTKNSHLSPDPKDVLLKFKDNSVRLKDDGNVEIITKSKFSVENDSEELIALLSELIQEISVINTNTIFGVTPINNKPAFIALKSRLDTLKR